MEEREFQADGAEQQGKAIGRRTRRNRQRAEQLLAAQRARLEQVEVELSQQLDHLSQVVNDGLSTDARAAHDDLDRRAEALAEQAQRQQLEAEQVQSQLQSQRDELARAKAEIEAATAALRQDQLAFRLAQDEHQAEVQQFARRSARSEELQKRLERESEELERRREETKSQRRRIAQEMKAQRSAQQVELDQLRGQVEQFQVDQQRGFDQATRKLQREREELERKLEAQQQDLHKQQTALAAKEAALGEASRQLDERRTRLASEQSDEAEQLRHQIERLTAELAESRAAAARSAAGLAALDDAHAALQQEHDRLQQAHVETESALAELQRQHDRLRQQHDEAGQQRQELQQQHEAVLEQHQELRQQHEEALQQHQEIGQHRQELQQRVDELRQHHDALQSEREELSAQRDALREQLRALDEQHRELQETHAQAQRRATDLAIEAASDGHLPEEWVAEREMLIGRLADAETRLAEIDPNRVEELEQRCEMAIADVRDLKRRNMELEESLARAQAGGSRAAKPAAEIDGGSPDWEATKRRMLASLQADGDTAHSAEGEAGESDADSSEEAAAERLTIESTIQITDDIVAQKDRELAELKLLLSQQSDNIGSVAVGAAAIADVLGQDELIRQEREKLNSLQEEWREKLRRAEIDISIERARLARQRAEVDEKLQNIETHRTSQAPDGSGAAGDGSKKPVRGRWLARLGLKDDDAK